jgi:hypothetical protein
MSPSSAQSGHHDRAEPCPLLGVKRTSRFQGIMSAFDPKRTSVADFSTPTVLGCDARPEGKRMRRRNFIACLAGTAVAWPLAARTQQPAMPLIGLLGSATASGWARQVSAFHQGLRDGGYVEGRNVVIEARWADNQYDRLPAMAAELVRHQVALIVACSTPAASAAKAATATIPIVFSTTAIQCKLAWSPA